MAAALAWVVVLLAVCREVIEDPRGHSVYPIYARAGRHWLQGREVYRPEPAAGEDPLDGFRYSPLVACAMAPWTALPPRLGGVLWRLVASVLVLVAARAWWRYGRPGLSLPAGESLFLLLLLPFCLASVRNDQANLHVVALLLAAATAARGELWWLAATCLTAVAAWKLYPLAVALLLLAAYPRRLLLPMLVTLSVALLLPWALQRPAFVAGQYHSWLSVLSLDEERRYWPALAGYRDLWLLVRLAGVPLGWAGYEVVRLALAGLCAACVVLARRRGHGPAEVTALALTLGTAWLVTCGPAVEHSTLALLGPAVAWTTVDRLFRGRGAGLVRVAIGGGGAFLVVTLGGVLPRGTAGHLFGSADVAWLRALVAAGREGLTGHWLQPLAAAGFLLTVLGITLHRLARGRCRDGREGGRRETPSPALLRGGGTNEPASSPEPEEAAPHHESPSGCSSNGRL
jgi:hypothetical protein